ncbi:MAG: hypothetical protein WCC14_18625, partial [Acidobacteriaceae bacterium]
MTASRSAVSRAQPDPADIQAPISVEPYPAISAEPRGKLLQFPARPAPTDRPRVQALLAAEFLLLFAALPLAVFLSTAGRLDPLQPLWLASGVCLVLLLVDPTFDRSRLWNAAPLGRQLPQILALFAAGAVAIGALVYEYAP